MAIASFAINKSNVGDITRYNNEINDDVAFARAGMMHNFSHLGGLLGVVTGESRILRERRRLNKQTSQN